MCLLFTGTIGLALGACSVPGSTSPLFKLEAHEMELGLGICFFYFLIHMSLVLRKPVFGVSDQVRHKPCCTTTQDG